MKQKHILLTILATMLLWALPIITQTSRAQENPKYDQLIEGYLQSCDNVSSTLGISQCFHKVYLALDRKLSQLWRQVLRRIDRDEFMPRRDKRIWKRRISVAQKAWLRFRKVECEDSLPNQFWGGTHASIAYEKCLIIKTLIRLKDLQEYL